MTDIKKLTHALREEHGTRDPFAIARAMGMQIIVCPLPESIRGFYLMLFDTQLIYINDTLEGAPQAETCAHELGHALMHPDLNTLFIKANTDMLVGRYEREAELFSVCLLYDDCFAEDC